MLACIAVFLLLQIIGEAISLLLNLPIPGAVLGMVMMLICFFLTLMREILYIGYLFLIGSEQSLITLVRALLCCGYSALMILPGSYLISKVMRWHLPMKRKHSDLNEKSDATVI